MEVAVGAARYGDLNSFTDLYNAGFPSYTVGYRSKLASLVKVRANHDHVANITRHVTVTLN